MSHKLTFDTMDAVPEELRYEGLKPGEDGKVVVTVVPKSKVDEFRQRNIEVSQERDTLKAQTEQFAALVGEDPAAFKAELDEMRDIQKKVKAGTLKVSDEIEAEINQRVASMREAYEEQLKTERDEKGKANKRAEDLDRTIKSNRIESMITEAALRPESGVLPSAIKNLIRDAQEVYVFPDDGGAPTPKRKGVTLYGEDGTSAMTPTEWIASLKKDMPHYFKQSKGAGAQGGDTPGNLGVSADELGKLSARQRLELANQATFKQKRGR